MFSASFCSHDVRPPFEMFVCLRLQVMKFAMGSFRGYISADGVKASVTGQGDTCGHEATTDTTIGVISENL